MMALRRAALLALSAGVLVSFVLPAQATQKLSPTYADLGPAADFTLIDEGGQQISRSQFDGTTTMVSFMFTRCVDICPILTSKLADIADQLVLEDRDFRFLTVTVDPAHDTPDVLKDYAENLEYSAAHWSFLTGETDAVEKVARDYGVFMAAHPHATVQHSLVTTLIDKEGVMRVQYLGERFDTDELLADLRNLTE